MFGGASFVNTERVFDIRIFKYCIFDKDDVLRTTGILGGIPAVIDPRTASLNLSSDSNKLSGRIPVFYLSIDINREQRQAEVLKSITNEFRSRKTTLTMFLADQIIHDIETNYTASDAMDQHSDSREKTT